MSAEKKTGTPQAPESGAQLSRPKRREPTGFHSRKNQERLAMWTTVGWPKEVRDVQHEHANNPKAARLYVLAAAASQLANEIRRGLSYQVKADKPWIAFSELIRTANLYTTERERDGRADASALDQAERLIHAAIWPKKVHAPPAPIAPSPDPEKMRELATTLIKYAHRADLGLGPLPPGVADFMAYRQKRLNQPPAERF